MRIPVSFTHTYEFACHSASCRPPGSGGTGGSTRSSYQGGALSKEQVARRATRILAQNTMGNARGTMGKAKYVRSDGTPVSKDYPGARTARQRMADRATGSTPGITAHVKAEAARLGGTNLRRELIADFKKAEAAGQPKISKGKVTVAGKVITTKIVKDEGGWHARMLGPDHRMENARQRPVEGTSRADVARKAASFYHIHAGRAGRVTK